MMSNGTPSRFMLMTAVTAVAFLLPLPGILFSQDRWKLLDVNLDSGFETDVEWPGPGAQMFWRDTLIGYYHTFTETDPDAGLNFYYTSNGGTTWTLQDSSDPIPHTFIDDQFGYSPDAFITKDGGQSWQRLTAEYTDTNYFPDQNLRYVITESMAGTPNNIVVFYQLHDADSPTADSVPFGPFRLAFSRDRGESWRFVDSLKYFGLVLQQLDARTDFGFFQAPKEMTDTTLTGWWKLFRMSNDSVAVVGTRAFGVVDGQLENHYYLGKLNLNNFAAQWFKIPIVEALSPPPAAALDFQLVNDTIAYIVQTEFVDVSNNSEDLKWTVWRSDNGMETWEEINTPPWIDYNSLRFHGETHGVTSNAFTNDGGKTWTEWRHPFGNDPLFYSIDSAHYKLANRFSLFASSSDGGHNWQHNEAGGIPLAINAIDGRVIVGRNYQSLLISQDSGETWRDLGAEGSLPAPLSRVIAIGLPDPRFNADRVIAIGTFIEHDATFGVSVLESTDGGKVWSVGQQLPELIGSVGTVQLLFVGDSTSELGPPIGFLYGSNGLMVSENAGISWTMRNDTHSFERIAMLNIDVGAAVTSDGIYVTGDGGRSWTKQEDRNPQQTDPIGMIPTSPNDYVAFFSDRASGYRNWSLEESQAGGQTWNQYNGTGAVRPMDIGAYWGDTSNIHTVGRAGVILHSDDKGRTFVLRNDSVPTFKSLAGFVDAGQDRDYLYLIAPGNGAGRYYMHRKPPVSVPYDSDPAVSSAWLTSNPVHNGEATLGVELRGPTSLSISLYDMIGRHLSTEDAGLRGIGKHHLHLNLFDLTSGRYIIEITTSEGTTQIPLVVVK